MIEELKIFMQSIQNEETVFWWDQIRKVDKQDKSFTSQNSSHLKLTHKDSVIKKLLNKFSNVFSEKKAVFLINAAQISHFIQLINKVQSLFESLYNLSANELEILRKYLKEM